MRLPTVIAAIAVVVTSTGGALRAHHSFAGEFDNSIAVTLEGVVTSVELVNPHSFIYLDVATEGAVERWALEGPGSTQMARMGFARDFVKPGDRLGACGYLARRDVTRTRAEPGTDTPSRKLQAAVLSMPHRGRFLWNNYGQGKCGLDTR